MSSPRPSLCLNIPKTGTTFLCNFFIDADILEIRRLFRLGHSKPLSSYNRKIWRRLRRRVPSFIYRGNLNYACSYQHTSYKEFEGKILGSDKRKPLRITTLRDIREWYVSWITYHIYTFKRCLPKSSSQNQINDISVEAFIQHVQNKRLPRRFLQYGRPLPEKEFGWLTMLCIRHLLWDPKKVFFLPIADFDEYFESGRYRQDMRCDVFLNQEKLVDQLCPLMSNVLGYHQEIISLLKENTRRVNVSPNAKKEKVRDELDRKNLWSEIFKREEIYLKYIYPLLEEGV